MKTRHLFLTAILAFLALSAVQADTPELINYQGRLTNPDGSPQAGTKTFSLSIWDDATGGAALYSEDLGEVLLDENGIYSFQFGADSAALAQALQAGGQHWIELTVDNAVLSPRQRILAVPFALKAAQADTAARAGSVGDDDGNVDITGNLDIAKNTTLRRDLNVEGDAIFRNNRTTFDGEVRLNGPVTSDGEVSISGALNAGRLEVFGPGGITRIDGIANIIYGDLETRFEGNNVEFRNNRTTFDGEVRLNGPVTSDGQVNISGALNAGRLEVDGGPFGSTRLDGVINRLSGDINQINAFETMFEGDRVRFRNLETRFDSEFNVFRGNETRFENNRTTFDGEVRLNGPITDSSHAVNKAYVDALGDTLEAKEAARVAALTNIDLVAPAPEIDGVTLAEGDRVLLAGQTNSTENGVYLSGADGILTRAGDFNAIEKIGGGSHLFIQEGSKAGQGYVLADLGEAFELGTSALAFSRFTVDPTQSLDLGNDLAVAGNADVDGALNAGRLEVNGPRGITRIDGIANIIYGDLDTRFEGNNVEFRNNRTTFDGEVRLNGPVTSDGEVSISGALNAGRLEVFGPGGITRIDGIANIIYGDLETRFEGNNVEFRNNRTTFDGEVRLNGPVTSDGQVNISGALNAGRLEVDGGPFGSTRLDGVINRLSGDINQINAFETMFEGDRVRFRNLETRFDSEFNVFRGNETRFENNRTTFDGEVRLNGPITDSSHAVNKAYVDALGDTLEAKEAARVAALTNIDLVAPAPEIDGVTLAEGDRVLLAGQTNSAENGVYLSGADGILTRAGDFNAIEKIGGGSHLFIQEGSKAGQGYVLADLGEAFELGTSALAFSRFTVDPTQSLDLGNDLAVAGNADVDGALNAGRLEVNGPRGITRIDGIANIIYGDLDTRFEGNNVEFRNNRTTFDGEVRLNGPVTSDGEVSISGALNAGRLEVFGPGGITRIDGIANIIYGDLETRFEGNNVEFRNNRTTFDGEVRLNGPVTSDGQVNISGALNAGRLEVDGGPFGSTRLDGVINRLSGDINQINAFETMFEGDRVRFRNLETRFDSEFNVFRGNETRFENNRTTFDGEVRLNGPITDSSHAVNKAYVDALGDTLEAKEAARVAALTNIDLVAPAPEIDGVTLAEGDRVLLAGQTNSAENGVYLSGADGILTRAGDFNAIEKIGGGSHLFIQEGSKAGQGYVLADLGEAFELGTSALAFSRFTVDPTQSLDLGNDLAVAGNADVDGALNAGRLEVNGPRGITRIDGIANIIYGDLDTRFEGNNVEFRNNRTTFDGEVRLNGPVTSDGEVSISGALNAGRLEVFGPGGITRIDGIANIIYGDLETRFEGNNVEFRNNRTTFDGEVRLNGPVTSDGQVNISGALNAGRLEVFGPGGITRIDGVANIIYGDLETRVEGGPLVVQGAVEALSFNTVSDRNRKENFEAVNGTEVLEKVTNLPVSTWNFIADEDSARHLGPTAQDFHAAFGLGEHETHISTVDVSGVAIAAIQGLDGKVDATRAELLQSNAALLEMVQALQARLETLEANQ